MKNKYIKKPVCISGKKERGKWNTMFSVIKSDYGLYNQIEMSVSVHTKLPPNIQKSTFLKAFKTVTNWHHFGNVSGIPYSRVMPNSQTTELLCLQQCSPAYPAWPAPGCSSAGCHWSG